MKKLLFALAMMMATQTAPAQAPLSAAQANSLMQQSIDKNEWNALMEMIKARSASGYCILETRSLSDAAKVKLWKLGYETKVEYGIFGPPLFTIKWCQLPPAKKKK